jgi:ergothioneine biosynthesis protein EgtB
VRQPFLFYLGHLPAFAWNQVFRGVLGCPSFHAEFDSLFERGIDPENENAPEAAERGWPSPADVLDYRDQVRRRLLDSFEAVARRGGEDVLAENGRIFRLVLEHERMHHETLLYMLQELAHDLKRPPAALVAAPRGHAAAEASWVEVPAGTARLGASFAELAFGWDNEFPAFDVDVETFEIESVPVRNRDFAEFVKGGGYSREDYWAPESWPWLQARGQEHPHSWRPSGDWFQVRGVFRDAPFDEAAEWPVQVSWAEADAYARWRGLRLPTEAQLNHAAYGTPDGVARAYPWGDDPPSAERANLGFERWAPAPAGAHPRGASAWGVQELVGNGWEWTSSLFGPFPGFEAYARTYPGYSKDFFDGRHYVLLGASWATDRSLVRRSFRNWFQPNYPYVFSKFRCVRGR